MLDRLFGDLHVIVSEFLERKAVLYCFILNRREPVRVNKMGRAELAVSRGDVGGPVRAIVLGGVFLRLSLALETSVGRLDAGGLAKVFSDHGHRCHFSLPLNEDLLSEMLFGAHAGASQILDR